LHHLRTLDESMNEAQWNEIENLRRRTLMEAIT
jgi:hypothetical protein